MLYDSNSHVARARDSSKGLAPLGANTTRTIAAGAESLAEREKHSREQEVCGGGSGGRVLCLREASGAGVQSPCSCYEVVSCCGTAAERGSASTLNPTR